MLDDMNSAALDAATLTSLLEEHRRRTPVLVDFDTAHRCLRALGRPLTAAQVRDLMVPTKTLGGRSVAPLADFINAADPYIKRAMARPNLKAKAAATARAAKKPAVRRGQIAGAEA